MTPKRENLRFYPSSAAAQSAGFRACLRCRPDASPGSPQWNVRADVAARAMKLIADGAVDRDGVSGLARRLGYSERQLHRLLVGEVGTGAIALARAQRAQTARILIETTDLAMADIAFAAGFASVRQFNDTIRVIFARTPSVLRQRHRARAAGSTGAVSLRLAYREPFAATALFSFLSMRAVPGIEEAAPDCYRRSLRLTHGNGVVELSAGTDCVHATFHLEDLRDLTTAVSRCRRLLDLDADPVAVDQSLGADPLLASLVEKTPGRRMPGTVDGLELAVRAIVGQQVSVTGARTVTGRIVGAVGRPLAQPIGAVTHVFPTPADLAAAPETAFSMPSSRRNCILDLAKAMDAGAVSLDPGADPDEAMTTLLEMHGIGRWTTAYISMRALADPDAFMPTDLGIRRALCALGCEDNPAAMERAAEAWRPWRSYAMSHLWALAPTGPTDKKERKAA
jgi:AraC family transcriptional regulator of adaptative response / DNA-3-methyladenine glycosylase II